MQAANKQLITYSNSVLEQFHQPSMMLAFFILPILHLKINSSFLNFAYIHLQKMFDFWLNILLKYLGVIIKFTLFSNLTVLHNKLY